MNDNFSEISEIETRFLPKKLSSLLLASSYDRIGYQFKYDRVLNCGTFLEFAHEIDSSGIVSEKGKLHNANFCRDRLCPMCSWRRSFKIFSQVSQIMDYIQNDYEFLFLSLTSPSVPGELLSKTITRQLIAFNKMTHCKRFKDSVCGYFRSLEVTRNNDIFSKSYGLYHPHLHIVLAVPKRYFKSKLYISQSEWLEMWQHYFGDLMISQVDVRKVRPKISGDTIDIKSAICEVSKYAAKDKDYLIPGDFNLTDDIVLTLSRSLASRRLCSYGGIFKETWKMLRLDDAEDGDLIYLDGEINSSLSYLILRYGWSSGCYKLSDSFVKKPLLDTIETTSSE